MWYAILSEDHDQSLPRRKSARVDHFARLQELVDAGRVLVAGPHPAIDSEEPGPAGFSGSLVIADFATLEEAQEWADNDPYVLANVYKRVTVKPFKLVLP